MRGLVWRSLVPVLAALVLIAIAVPCRANGAPIATVETLTGALSVMRSGGLQPVSMNMRGELYAGDVVRTAPNGKATLLFSDGSQVRLGAGASLRVSPPEEVKGKTSLFDAIFGQIWARLRPGEQVRTEYANLLVRGTEIDLQVADDGTTTLTVVEGSVEFFNTLGDVLVNTDQQSVVHPGAAPTTPITVGNADFLIEWTLDLDRALPPREKFYVSLDNRTLEAELARRAVSAGTNRTDAQAQLDYGDSLFDSRRYDEALKAYNAADTLTPNQPATLTRAGYALLELRQLDDAETRFQAAGGRLQAAGARRQEAEASAQEPSGRSQESGSANDALLRTVDWNPDIRGARVPAGTRGAGPGTRYSGWYAGPSLFHPIDWQPTSANDNDLIAQAQAAPPAPAVNLYVPAQVGLAWVALERNRPEQAGQLAEQAVAAAPTSLEAQLVLGLTWLRQPGHLQEAAAAFQAAAQGEPASQRYQAHAWLATTALAANDTTTALHEANLSAQLAPDSALAQANLATIDFFTDKAREAEVAARAALRLNPDSVAAQVALGQAELAQDEVNAAARTAARAAALDPSFAPAQYLLGISDADRRDYTHAERELKRAVALQPTFAPAVGALARVYVLEGHPKEAATYLAALPTDVRSNPAVFTAYGEALYRSGNYKAALAQLEPTAKGGSNSALFYYTLARVALDSNHLDDAIEYAQKAIELAPNVGQYHALLGLAYVYCQITIQAQTEFRTALTQDPGNALALVELAQLNQQGNSTITERTAVLLYTQAFTTDPLVARELVRPGTESELTAGGGTRNSQLDADFWRPLDEGNITAFGQVVRNRDDGNRDNSDSTINLQRLDTTFLLGAGTNGYVSALHARTDSGLPGPESNPVSDDRDTLLQQQGIITLRRKFGRGYLWGGILDTDQDDERVNPNLDTSFVANITAGFGIDPAITDSVNTARTTDPELRYDLALGQRPEHAGTLTFGVAHPRTSVISNQVLYQPPFTQSGITYAANTGLLSNRLDAPVTLAYGQLTQSLGSRAIVVAQLRRERVGLTAGQSGVFISPGTTLSLGAPSQTTDSAYTLPSILATYKAGARTLFRLQASQQITDIISSIFVPEDTLISTEPQAQLNGYADVTNGGGFNTFEFDAERYLHAGDVFKLYAFHSVAHNFIYDFSNYQNPNDYTNSGNVLNNNIEFTQLSRQGLGVRYDHPFQHGLFGEAGFAVNHTVGYNSLMSPIFFVPVPAPYNGQQAPYYPRYSGTLTLNYVSNAGNKASLNFEHDGPVYEDTNDPTVTPRPESPSTNLFNLRLAHEPTVHDEFFLQFTNLLNSRQVVFNGIPVNPRRTTAGWTHRF